METDSAAQKRVPVAEELQPSGKWQVAAGEKVFSLRVSFFFGLLCAWDQLLRDTNWSKPIGNTFLFLSLSLSRVLFD